MQTHWPDLSPPLPKNRERRTPTHREIASPICFRQFKGRLNAQKEPSSLWKKTSWGHELIQNLQPSDLRLAARFTMVWPKPVRSDFSKSTKRC
jgi:hypothetical protein